MTDQKSLRCWTEKKKMHESCDSKRVMKIPKGDFQVKTRLFYFIASVLIMMGCTGCMGAKSKVYINSNINFRFIKKVAVFPFENLSQDRFAGKKVRDIFVTTLLASEVVEVPELGEVVQAMNTLGLGMGAEESGFAFEEQGPASTITKDTAMALGKAIGIQGIILGSVEEYSIIRSTSGSYPEVSLSLRMIDTKTGSIIWAVMHTEKGSRIIPSILGIGEETLSEAAIKATKKIVDTLVYE